MSNLFDSFRIGRFRGFRDVEFSECGSTNLLIGANNSGKSTVLEALAIYCRPFDKREWLAVLERREARSGRGARIDDLYWLFPREAVLRADALLPAISLAATGLTPVESLEARAERASRLRTLQIEIGEGEFEDNGQFEETGVDINVAATASRFSSMPYRETLDFWPDGNFTNTEASPTYREVRSLTPFSHRIEPLQLKRLTQAGTEGWKPEVLKLLGDIDPAILDLEILTPDGVSPSLHVNYAGLGLAPISVLGDGLRRVVSIALAVANLKNGLLLIDEIESAIHVSALETVFNWLTGACRRNNVQLFATTHSLEALDALLPTAGGEMACFRLNRPNHPKRVERFAPDLLRRLRFNRGLDVRQAP